MASSLFPALCCIEALVCGPVVEVLAKWGLYVVGVLLGGLLGARVGVHRRLALKGMNRDLDSTGSKVKATPGTIVYTF